MTKQQPDALMSYTRFDDKQNGAYLTTFRERLSGEVCAHTGQPFHIFQDIKDIKWGQQFEQRIDQALATITFFIPILTPSFFKSGFCRYELEKFLAREQRMGRSDLVLPVYYIRVPALEHESLRVNDPLAQTIAARQYIDWRELRFEDLDSPKARRTLAKMAEQIADALVQGVILEPPPPAADPQPQPAPPPIVPVTQPVIPEPQPQPAVQIAVAPSSPPEQEQQEPDPSTPNNTPTGHTPTVSPRRRPRRNRTMLLTLVVIPLLIAVIALARSGWPIGTVAPTITPSPSTAPTITPSPSPSELGIVTVPIGTTGQEIEMVPIPAGPFLIGSRDDDSLADDAEKPQHELTLDAYWIGKTEVTNAQFHPFVQSDGYTNPDYWTEAGWQWREENSITQPAYWDDAAWNGDQQPVVGVSWYEAVAYARWLREQTGHDFRLPTEAEWEKAARGPDGRIWPWGNTWVGGNCNCADEDDGTTRPVGSFPAGASPYGLLDMAGNAWEWTATKGLKDYPYQVEDEWTEVYLAGEEVRVVRGGSWFNEQKYVRGAYRNIYHYNPRYRNFSYGVRVVSHSPLQGSDE